MRLSKNFSLHELTQSQTASRNNIDNTPNEQVIDNLKILCEEVLQPIRDHYQSPVIVTSGYRSSALNAAIGGSSNSQHCLGMAADFEVIGHSNDAVARWIRDNLYFDQLIREFPTKNDPQSGWVHCSYRPRGGNRNEVLTIDRNGVRFGIRY